MAHDKDKDKADKTPADDGNDLPELTDLDLPAFTDPDEEVATESRDEFRVDELPEPTDSRDEFRVETPPELTDSFEGPAMKQEGWTTDPASDDDIVLSELPELSEVVPTAEAVPAEFGVPDAEPGSFHGEDAAGPESFHGEVRAEAEGGSWADLPAPDAEPASFHGEDESPEVSYDPVVPASGWLETPSMVGYGDAPAPSSSGSGPESSDIFARGHQPRAAAEIPGGLSGTVRTPPPVADADADLPIAEEIPDDEDDASVFDAAAAGSSRLAYLPELPGEQFGGDSTNLGASPPRTPDASNILAELSHAEMDFDHDASGVRLDAPGMDRTLSDEPAAPGTTDGTAAERVPRQFRPGRPSTPSSAEWNLPAPGALGDAGRTASDDDDQVNPFTSAEPDQPSLGSAQSSIFSGGKIPGATEGMSGGSGGSDALRMPGEDSSIGGSSIGDPDEESILAADEGTATHGDIDFDLPARGSQPTVGSAVDSSLLNWTAPEDDSSITTGRTPDQESGWIVPGEHVGGTVPSGNKGPAGKAGRPKSKPDVPAPRPGRKASDPSVVVDFVSQSAEEAAVRGGTRPKSAATVALLEEPKRGGKGGWLGGGAVGLFTGVAVCAGLYFGGVLDGTKDTGGTPKTATGNTGGGGTGDGVRPIQIGVAPANVPESLKALDLGDADAALKGLRQVQVSGQDTAATRSSRASAEFLVRFRGDAPITADDPALKQALAGLQTAFNDPEAKGTPEAEKAAVRAAVHLGLAHELSENFAEARKVYAAAAQKFPKSADVFQAALDRLAVTAPDAGKTSRLSPAEAERLATAAAFLLTFAQEPAEGDDAEAGVFYWKAVNAATAGKYADAIDQITKAKAAHQKRAKAFAGRGINPLSDPLEQIFARCCDDLKASWELRKTIYDHATLGPIAKKDGVDKALNQLALAEKKAAEAATLAATNLKAATEKLTAAETGLKAEQEKATKLGTEVKMATDAAAKLDAEAKAAKSQAAAAEMTLAGLVKELQGGKLLPEKFDAAALLAAQKEAVIRATGPNLGTLMPGGMAGAVGVALPAGHLIDLADRLTKSDAAAKAATDKLAAETKRLEAALADGTAKLKEAHTAETKKLTDSHSAAMKKLTDSHSVEIKKFTDNPIADKLKAEHAADVKKLNDAHAADAKKLADKHAEQVRSLQAAVADEKSRAEGLVKQFKADLGNAIGPAQALDLWLPILNTLRRPADADPAGAVAAKVLSSAAPDSEDAAKALTVSGLSALLKGDADAARKLFLAAKRHRAFAADKEWSKAAELGLATTDDPLAPQRAIVNPQKKNPSAAARFLDSGIAAYKAGRYADAVRLLADAAQNDGTDPVVWYYLGASRWQAGNREAAATDFRQGAERESQRVVSAKTIDAALIPIQGPVRDALTNARP